MTILFTLSYDGRNYCGWQRQHNGVAVQEVLEKALSQLYGYELHVLGASRTDAGVHAQGQRAALRLEQNPIPLDRLPLAINAYLPKDVVVTFAEEVEDGFHPIRNAVEKTYEYIVYNAPYIDPRYRDYCYFVSTPLDIDKMRQATGFFIGRHDFKAFCATGSERKSTIRTVYSLTVELDGDLIRIEITGDGFLYNMVRIIAGTLVEVGQGRIPVDSIPKIIQSGKRDLAGRTAPAGGLTLLEVAY